MNVSIQNSKARRLIHRQSLTFSNSSLEEEKIEVWAGLWHRKDTVGGSSGSLLEEEELEDEQGGEELTVKTKEREAGNHQKAEDAVNDLMTPLPSNPVRLLTSR